MFRTGRGHRRATVAVMIERRTVPLVTPARPHRTLPARRRGVAWIAVGVVAVLVAVFLLADTADSATTAAVADVSPDGRTGVLVHDRETGETLLADDADEPFRSASLVKLLIAIDLLHRSGRADRRLRRLLADSDDRTASELWSAGGGPAIVSRTASLLGLTGTRPPADADRWGDTLVTAEDVGAVYRYILALPSARRDVLLTPLRSAPRRAADGFDQHFGIPPALPGQRWAIKQGWAAGRGGVEAHTSGLVGPRERYIVVLLTAHPEGTDLTTATRAATAGAATLGPLLR